MESNRGQRAPRGGASSAKPPSEFRWIYLQEFMPMLKKLLIGLVVVIVLFVIVVALQPSTYSVNRSTVIDAPPAQVFALVNNFRQWEDWSPWAKLDPNAKSTFSGEPAGEGAVFAWDGNDDVGAGQMTILESKPTELILINLEFTRPFEDQCTTRFTFEPHEGKTRVTWNMSGNHNFISKAMCLFTSMDSMIGGDFERGLANMKSLAEKQSSDAADTPADATSAPQPESALPGETPTPESDADQPLP